MGDTPISMRIELDGIEPTERFTAALDELGAAAAEMLADASDEVSGFAFDARPGVPRSGLLDYDWIAKVDTGASHYVYTPEFKKLS